MPQPASDEWTTNAKFPAVPTFAASHVTDRHEVSNVIMLSWRRVVLGGAGSEEKIAAWKLELERSNSPGRMASQPDEKGTVRCMLHDEAKERVVNSLRMQN